MWTLNSITTHLKNEGKGRAMQHNQECLKSPDWCSTIATYNMMALYPYLKTVISHILKRCSLLTYF